MCQVKTRHTLLDIVQAREFYTSAVMAGVFLLLAVVLLLNEIRAQAPPQQLVRFVILAAPESTEPLLDVQPPKITFMVQRMDSQHEILGFDTPNSHLFMVDDKEQLIGPMLNWTDFGPYMQIGDMPTVCKSLPQGNCTGITMSSWTLWNTLFGFTENDVPGNRRFRFHFPVVLVQVTPTAQDYDYETTTTTIVVANQDSTVTFVCVDCAGYHLRSQMSATDGWILGSLFFGVLLCMFIALCWTAYADQVPAVPLKSVTTRTETTYA